MAGKIQNQNLLSYLDYTKQPWGKLFYKIIFKQLPECKNKRILDFGSGFGITANHMAKSNRVTAVEPSDDMLTLGSYDEDITLYKNAEILSQLPDKSFDAIICHNVLEYTDNRREILRQFCRLLADDGFISIVKHNKAGRIMQKAVFDYEIDSVKKMLNNENLTSVKFGEIRIYENKDLINDSDSKLKLDSSYGICTFYGLQNNNIKFCDSWINTMLDLELSVSQIEEFRNIAFYHHLILKKQNNHFKGENNG